MLGYPRRYLGRQRGVGVLLDGTYVFRTGAIAALFFACARSTRCALVVARFSKFSSNLPTYAQVGGIVDEVLGLDLLHASQKHRGIKVGHVRNEDFYAIKGVLDVEAENFLNRKEGCKFGVGPAFSCCHPLLLTEDIKNSKDHRSRSGRSKPLNTVEKFPAVLQEARPQRQDARRTQRKKIDGWLSVGSRVSSAEGGRPTDLYVGSRHTTYCAATATCDPAGALFARCFILDEDIFAARLLT